MPKDKSSNPVIDLISRLVNDVRDALKHHHTSEFQQLRNDIKSLHDEQHKQNHKITMIIDELQASVTSLQTTTQTSLADLTASVDEAIAEISSQFPGDVGLLALKGTIDAVAASIQSGLASNAQRLRDAIAAAPVPTP